MDLYPCAWIDHLWSMRYCLIKPDGTSASRMEHDFMSVDNNLILPIILVDYCQKNLMNRDRVINKLLLSTTVFFLSTK